MYHHCKFLVKHPANEFQMCDDRVCVRLLVFPFQILSVVAIAAIISAFPSSSSSSSSSYGSPIYSYGYGVSHGKHYGHGGNRDKIHQ
jgi:hypothetical protein